SLIPTNIFLDLTGARSVSVIGIVIFTLIAGIALLKVKKEAPDLTMQMWHEETVTIIEQGKQAGEFTFTANATDIAWRLIALVCG
ncbi:hypothetical protein MJM99_33040, partial [Salmonella enterica subsp. enterica serovar Kentucky]|nr:hypothetical protein [Salmonella enterica subsp. enterica serovar Kentucky]